MHIFQEYLKPLIEFASFRASQRYRLLRISETRLNNTKYYRSWIRIWDSQLNMEFGGMAEAETRVLSRIRALSEAYEKSSVTDYIARVGIQLDLKRVFGIGVSIHERLAARMAYGEFLERSYLGRKDILKSLSKGGKKQFVEETPRGLVHVCLMISEDEILGSGYGATKKLAENSASRSILRKRDFPELQDARLDLGYFAGKPQIVNITPACGAWLQCVFVGALK